MTDEELRKLNRVKSVILVDGDDPLTYCGIHDLWYHKDKCPACKIKQEFDDFVQHLTDIALNMDWHHEPESLIDTELGAGKTMHFDIDGNVDGLPKICLDTEANVSPDFTIYNIKPVDVGPFVRSWKVEKNPNPYMQLLYDLIAMQV